MSAPAVLVETLCAVTPPEYVRFVADWLRHANDLDVAPELTGVRPFDALVRAPVVPGS